MPSLTALDILVRPEPLNNEQWIDLIEARRRFIKPHIENLTLPELRQLKCCRHVGHEFGELLSRKTIGDNRFSTSTQGIFGVQPWKAEERTPTASGYLRKAWGLTRSNQWVLIPITYITTRGYKDRGAEVITQVEIIESDLATILRVTQTPPVDIWQALHTTIQTWLKRQEQLHNQLLNMHATMIMENRALKQRLSTS